MLASGKFQLAESSFVEAALLLVSAAGWRFGRVRGMELVHFSCHDSSERQGIEIERFLACYRRLRRNGVGNVACVKDAAYPYAVALWFPDPAADAAMLVLLRDAEQGPFTREELALLALIADFGETFLNNSSLAEPQALKTAVARRRAPLVFIVDRTYRIAIRTSPYLGDDPTSAFRAPNGDRLPKLIEEAVRGMTTAWESEPYAVVDAIAMPMPFMVVRAQSMESTSAEGRFLAVTIDRVRPSKILQRAVQRYQITPRESDVLAFLLDGMRIEEIADRLSIAISTVNDHVKSLISRTRSTNRSQMLARILGWDGSSAEVGGPRTIAASSWRSEDSVNQLA